MAGRRIFHLIETISIGGAEKLLCNTVSELGEYEHVIVSLFSPADVTILPSNAKHVCLNAGSIKTLLLQAGKYKRLLNEWKPDVVHAHLYFAVVFAKLLTPSYVTLLFTQHFEFSKNATKWYYAAVDRLVSKKSQTCIAVSTTVLNDYLQSTGFSGATEVLGNYIPDRFFSIKKQLSQQQTLKLVALGNIKPIKNQRYLLAAFIHLKGLPVACDVYGDGPERTQLQEEAKRNGLAVCFKGSIGDSAKVLGLYDAYIMPSLTEGSPLALFEAMAAGLPPIVSDIPVFQELLGDAGLYLDLQQPTSLRRHVEQLLTQPLLRETLGTRAKNMAIAKASKKVYLEKLRALYAEK